MPFGPRITEKLYEEHGDGYVTCKRCGYTWRFVRENKRRACPGCKRTIYPAPERTGRCHAFCRGKECWIKVHDWIVARQVWKATPGKDGIVWKIAEESPTNLHDVMLEVERTKQIVVWFFNNLKSKGRLVGRRQIVKPPMDVHGIKQKVYFYNNEKKYKKAGYRAQRPTFIQYLPTHWAMVDFLDRNPDAIEKVNGHIPMWKPIRILTPETIVRYAPKIIPLTELDRYRIKKRIQEGMERNNRQVGYPIKDTRD